MEAIDVVKAYYASDVANDAEVVSKFFHKDCELHWTGSQGFKLHTFNTLDAYYAQTRNAYDNLRTEFTHLFQSENSVVARHTIYGIPIEDTSKEIALGHFCTIWEVKDNKLYRGYEISQQADESDTQCMASYVLK